MVWESCRAPNGSMGGPRSGPGQGTSAPASAALPRRLAQAGPPVLQYRRRDAAASTASPASAPAGAGGARPGASEQPRAGAGAPAVERHVPRLDRCAARPLIHSEPDMIPKPFTPDADLLAGRIILITRAGSGFGRALPIESARAGATVILFR